MIRAACFLRLIALVRRAGRGARASPLQLPTGLLGAVDAGEVIRATTQRVTFI